jgi:hypothetical protein
MINGPIAPSRNFVGMKLYCSPRIRDESVFIANGFCTLRHPIRAREQHGAGSKKRFDIVIRIAEGRPHFIGDTALSSEIRERGL